jgi:hypothetical protein
MAYRQLEPAQKKALLSPASRGNELTPDVRRFKGAYVLERRTLEQIRHGKGQTYNPSKTLDGRAKYVSMERPLPKNQWNAMYVKLRNTQPLIPWQYVRLLFAAIRPTDYPIPQVMQLASESNREIIVKYLTGIEETLRVQFAAEYQRANTKITYLRRGGAGYSFARAVYYALVDQDLGLSAMFRYALAASAASTIRAQSDNDTEQMRIVSKLEALGEDAEAMAALDYAVFPDLYDEIWGRHLPDRLRLIAPDILAEALSV